MESIQVRENRRHSKPREQRGHLTSFSQGIIENIYQAITGTAHIPGHFVRRALANGLPKPELQDAIRCARSAKMLPDYLLSASEQKLEKAFYFDELGLKQRARELYLESVLWALNAELLIQDEDRRHQVWTKYRESYRRAAPYFQHPAEEVTVPYMASNLSGYLRVPASEDNQNSEKPPVVVLLNSIFSAREELHYLENSLLSQGFATLSFDYPGVDKHSAQVPSSFDVKELGNSIYLFLSTRNELDSSRITLYGLSLGGRMAIHMALSYPERFSSLVCMSTPLDLLKDLDRLAPVFAREHMVSPFAARTALYELAMHTQIDEGIPYTQSPLLVVGGGKDKIATTDDTKQIFEQSLSTDKKLILCPAAGHCLYEMMPSLRYEIAQWIKQRA